MDQDVLVEYDQYLCEYVYEKVYSELSAKEKEIVLNMNEEDTDITSLREKMNIDTKSMSVYRNRLIKKGVITPTSYGNIAFSLPRFNEFLMGKR